MFKLMRFNCYNAGIIIIMITFTVSCVPINQLQYFNDLNDIKEPVANQRTQKRIMPFDKLYIEVYSIDAKILQTFTSSEQMRYGSGNNGVLGYLVDEAGNINFPFVGDINVGSLTTSQVSEKIQKALIDYVGNTSIIVKYIDNQVTVIGEVQRQGVYSFTQDKLNIFEAVGLGGGLTRYGDRKNVILIRNEGNKILHYRLNLSDSKISGKVHYYILPNDVIIVEPLKAISSSYQNITFSTVLTTVTTLIAVLLFSGLNL
jgi:polysaccharide export outer membrane protein